MRRERDSNPRYLSVRRFSRPMQSTTLPSLQNFFRSASVEWFLNCDAKVVTFRETTKFFLDFFRKIFQKTYFLLKSVSFSQIKRFFDMVGSENDIKLSNPIKSNSVAWFWNKNSRRWPKNLTQKIIKIKFFGINFLAILDNFCSVK